MTPFYQEDKITIYQGSALQCLQKLPADSVQSVVTSPPYWGLRDYGVSGQIGLEETPEAYVSKLVHIFGEVKRVLKPDGTLWLNLGDAYSHKGHGSPKNLLGIPWRIAFALQADGWYLRCDIIWSKPNPMPESVTDRPTKAHEYLFLMTKSERYHYDAEAIKEPATDTGRINGKDGRHEDAAARPPNSRARTLKRLDYSQTGRNKRSVWTIPTQPYPEAHFATFPEDLVTPCILAGAPAGSIVLDPFTGSGTVALVARRNGNQFIGIELNPEYCKLAAKRLSQQAMDFLSVE